MRGIFDSPRISELMYFNREYLEQTPARRPARRGRHPSTSSSTTRRIRPASPRPIDDQFHNSTAQTKTESEQAFIAGLRGAAGQRQRCFLLAISAAVMFTILLVSANTMAMSVRERVREVGVLKTLGFTSGRHPRPDSGRGLRHLVGRRLHRLS